MAFSLDVLNRTCAGAPGIHLETCTHPSRGSIRAKALSRTKRSCGCASTARFVREVEDQDSPSHPAKSVSTLARIAGHSSIKLSERYVHPNDEAVMDSLERMTQQRELSA